MVGGLARGRLRLTINAEEECHVLEKRVDQELHVQEHVVYESVLAAEVGLCAATVMWHLGQGYSALSGNVVVVWLCGCVVVRWCGGAVLKN